ncbi:MAG: cold shock domain-containing protein, partial [Pseudomonadota bacterium]
MTVQRSQIAQSPEHGGDLSAENGATTGEAQDRKAEGTQSDAITLSGQVKWFDSVRGYGFVIPEDGGSDVLVHYSCLKPHDRRALPEGASVVCEVVERPRGRQALKLVSIDLSTAIGPDPDARPERPNGHADPLSLIDEAGPPEAVRVNWFNRLNGYGFLTLGDETRSRHQQCQRIAHNYRDARGRLDEQNAILTII